MTIFFTSDHHFGHRNIVSLANRRFDSVEEMDQVMIDRWNAVVKDGDLVYHLGDFVLGAAEMAERYLDQLNGEIHLIWGNHDRKGVRDLPRWASSQYVKEVAHEWHKIVLCHYAMRVWPRCHRKSLMLYGHSHGTLPGNSQSLDVGVDAWDFYPVSLPSILKRMSLLPPYEVPDHHGDMTE